MQIHEKSWGVFFLLITSLLCLFFILLGARVLYVPDEGRYAEIAREMVASGNYITPYLNGIKYFEKPILFYWLTAFAIKMGGLNLWAIRSVNAGFALLTCLATYFTTKKCYDQRTAILAVIILATNLLFFFMAHLISLDIGVTAFIAIALFAFLLAVHLQQKFYYGLCALASALAVLTKGLIGIVFPGLIIGSWILIFNRYDLLKQIPLTKCIFIFLLIALPWHLWVSWYNPEFLHFYFIEQHFLRYATVNIGHNQPAWFFLPILILGFFPWIFLLPLFFMRLSTHLKAHKIETYFLLWASIIFIFFSCSHSKLIPYILPIFPALSIMTAIGINKTIIANQHRASSVLFFLLWIAAFVMLFTFTQFFNLSELPDIEPAKKHLYLAAVILILGTGSACFLAYKHQLEKAVLTTGFTSGLFLLLLITAFPILTASRSIYTLVEPLKNIFTANETIVSYNYYFQDLPFYLQRPIFVLNWRNELSFGSLHQQQNLLINDKTFWQMFHSKKCVFVFIPQDDYQKFLSAHGNERFFTVAQTVRAVLISNRDCRGERRSPKILATER